MRRLPYALGAGLAIAACEGPVGPPGPPGASGPGLDASLPLDGGPLSPGEAGPLGEAATALEDGASALSGRVRDPSGQAVSGQVVLVPAARVAALAATPIDLTLAPAQAAQAENDEPLEDLLVDPTLPRAALAGGAFRFESVPEGEHFVVYTSAAPSGSDDALHLPGGQLARTPFAASALRGASLELTVSGAPSPNARYIGSAACIGCHARHTTFASGHALTLRVPGLSTLHQDATAAPQVDEALERFRAGETLYYSDCDETRVSGPICRVGSTMPAPPARVFMRARLVRDQAVERAQPGRYYVELSTDLSQPQRYPVVLTLGGTRSLQQYVTRVALPDGSYTHFVLPFSYQRAGSVEAGAAFSDAPLVGYRERDWLDLATGTLRTPAHADSFERQCAGCHATGFVARGSDLDGYHGSAAAAIEGVYDLDGDGRKEQLAVGCESCHGPGSEHLEVTPRGQRIVSPRLLTPERQALVCGTCHARARGKHGELAPLDEELRMPRAGMARSSFVAQHLSSLEEPGARHASGDTRLPFAQYGDFIRSPKYRSSQLLVSCTDCHDAHRSAGFASDLKQASGDESCAGCHAAQREVLPHVAAHLRFGHDVGIAPTELLCTRCHMVKTGLAGARVAALRDISAVTPEQYMHGDRTSHRFVFTDRSRATAQPVAATNRCAPCHGEFLPVP